MIIKKYNNGFVLGLPGTRLTHDTIRVIVDRLIKSAHFLVIKINNSIEKLTKLYIKEIVTLHGIPTTFISNRDHQFTTRFWTNFQNALDTKLDFSTAFYCQTDGQS